MARRLRSEQGFGVVELVVALTLLSIAIFATFAMLNAGAASVLRASRTATASTLAERQLELYRAMLYGRIGLDAGLVAAAVTDSVHAGDAACGASCAAAPTGTQTVVGTCTSTAAECKPVQAPVRGPDDREYRIDTYVSTLASGAGGVTGGRDVKRVTVVVRRYDDNRTLARYATTFDLSTGCAAPPC
jgi:type II secretory pathway pseudopilin PulG